MKLIFFTLLCLSLFFLSCSKDEVSESATPTQEQNSAPGSFAVTVTSRVVALNAYEYVVTWTAAVDPEGDTVVYDVEIANKKIAVNITGLTTTISQDKLADGVVQSVKVTARDSKGAESWISKGFKKE